MITYRDSGEWDTVGFVKQFGVDDDTSIAEYRSLLRGKLQYGLNERHRRKVGREDVQNRLSTLSEGCIEIVKQVGVADKKMSVTEEKFLPRHGGAPFSMGRLRGVMALVFTQNKIPTFTDMRIPARIVP
jgi:hypothetical protein